MAARNLQIKVTLLDTKPPIWRRLLVPENFTLAQLHMALQICMGWQDSHLHEFQLRGERFGIPDPEERAMGIPPCTDERKVRLSAFFDNTTKASYTYDFGDGWEHSLVVEKNVPAEAGYQYPLCTAGKRRCPPEDCGGVPGFYNLLMALVDPEHPEREELLQWVGGSFDPVPFSIDAVNEQLCEEFPRSLKRAH